MYLSRNEQLCDQVMWCLNQYFIDHSMATLTVALDARNDDFRIYVFDGDLVQGRVWIRGYPCPHNDRFMVNLVKDCGDEVKAMFYLADQRLDGLLRHHYRTNPLRPHVAPTLQQLLERVSR